MKNPDMLSIDEAADSLAITPGTLRGMIRAGAGPTVVRPSPGLTRIKRADLNAYVDLRTFPPRT